MIAQCREPKCDVVATIAVMVNKVLKNGIVYEAHLPYCKYHAKLLESEMFRKLIEKYEDWRIRDNITFIFEQSQDSVRENLHVQFIDESEQKLVTEIYLYID